ncbi:MAG: hypothetical protein GVY26_05310 [Bacteroidetes bacterium]|jgi:hypothetical protein|nr:hypothetical protein [Bacteroidota bacterium]
MGEILHTFEAASSGAYTNFVLSIIAALVGIGGMLYLLRREVSREQRNLNIVIAMLLFFLFLIGSSTAFFSYMRLRKVGPVDIYEAGVKTPYGKVAFQDIRNAEIIVDEEPNVLSGNTGRRTRMLTIIERDGKTHALSEEDYPIQEILGKMKQAIKDRKPQKEE